MTSTLTRRGGEGGGGVDKIEMLSDVGVGGGVSECSGRPIFFFFFL